MAVGWWNWSFFIIPGALPALPQAMMNIAVGEKTENLFGRAGRGSPTPLILATAGLPLFSRWARVSDPAHPRDRRSPSFLLLLFQLRSMQRSIEIKVRLFAGAAQAAAKTELVVQMDPDGPESDSVTIGQIAEKLKRDFPQLSTWIERSRWAVGDQFSALTTRVSTNQCVAMIPPVSGG